MFRALKSLCVACLFFSVPVSAWSQDPFGGGAESAAGARDPFGLGAAAELPEEPAEPAAAARAQPVETDPVVRAIQASNPTTPRELMHAVKNLVELGRPDRAKEYLGKLNDAGLDAATLVALQRQFGSALFMRLERDPRYAPEGGQLAKAVLETAAAAARDPARLNEWIRQLGDPSPDVRYAALVELNSGGSAAAVALIEALADENRSGEHPAIRSALVTLKGISRDPLVAALESTDPRLLAQVIVVLSKIDTGEAAAYFLKPYFTAPADSTLRQAAELGLTRLVGQVPGRGESERFLARRAQTYLAGQLAGRPDHEGMVVLWSWDENRRAPAAQRVPAAVASLAIAQRLASDLHSISPDNPENRRLYLVALLESAKRLQGLDQPLPSGTGSARAVAASFGQEPLVDALQSALKTEQAGAAAGILEVLGDIGDLRLLDSAGGAPAPLANALRHADPRVRFAAVQAIRQLDPGYPYAGASYLPEALGSFASGGGVRRALVVHPRLDVAQTLVGMLAELGFEGDVAQTGRAALLAADRQPNYEFALVSDAIDAPPVSELLQQFRRNPQSSHLPIGVLARQDTFDRMEQITAKDPQAEAFPRPHDTVGLDRIVRRLLDRAGHEVVSAEERMRYAAAALDYLAQLAEQMERYPFYDLLRQQAAIEQALAQAPLAEKAARVLGYLGSPAAQRVLVSMASQNARDLRERQAAAQAFDVAVQRRGLLLNRDEILLQYDRYNRSESLDRATQDVLGAILDSIEAPTRNDGGSATHTGG